MDFNEATERLHAIARDNGLEKVLNKLAEECAEYTAARLQYHERRTDDWIEELADIWILVQQAEILLKREPMLESRIMETAGRKIRRQIRRIEERGGKISDL